ncbi:MAG: chemotaxis protein CheX [Bacillota bacterium]
MKAQYVNPFYQATIDVFKLMLDLDINRCQTDACSKMLGKKEVGVIIDITGDLTGSILYRFPESMILEMVKIMSGMEMAELDGFVTSALGEVSNIISGNAVSKLSSEDYKCDIKPPRIIVDKEKPLTLSDATVLKIPLETAIGELQIQISLKEN